MISIFTGAPGAGKTAAMVDLLKSHVKDRPLFVHGLDGLSLTHIPLEDPTKWMETVPDGAVIVIDEVQTVWRPRGPGVKVPDHVAALETHRHRGLDFFLTTQGPNLLDANVRALVGRHVHIRDLGVLGRWWYEWPECAENCRTGFRNAPIKKRYRLPKRVFGDYKSASIHVKPIRSFPWALVVAAAALAGTGYLAWSVMGKINSKINGGGTPTEEIGRVSTQAANNGKTSVEDFNRKIAAEHAQAPAPVPVAPVLPPPPVIAGCAVARGVCHCFDTKGNEVGDDGLACARVGGYLASPLALENEQPNGLPSQDLAADLAMIEAVSRRQKTPFLR